MTTENISGHDADEEHPCGDPVGCRAVHEIVHRMPVIRMTLVVPETGKAMFISTLDTDQTLQWLEQAATEIRRTGLRRAVHQVSRPQRRPPV